MALRHRTTIERRGPFTYWGGEVCGLYPWASIAQIGVSTMLRYSSIGSAIDPTTVRLRLYMLQQSQTAATGADIDNSITATQGID